MSENQDFTPQEKLKKVHDVIEHPDKFSDVFCSALDSQVGMRKKIMEIILTLIKTDNNGRVEIKKLIQEVEKEELKFWFKKIGFFLWSALVFIMGSIATILITKMIG